jgi:site-specific DNA-methyltransferase (adenine-specific)
VSDEVQTQRGTSTSSFGVGRRESHDASGFYGRFTAPELSSDDRVGSRKGIDELFAGDARDMSAIEDASVALVVTSPPYFAGKEYETALGEGHIPATYADYLQMLEDVFAECVRKLEPGGRIAVNVANLGRKPYRSLSGDVTWILQDRLRLLLRGEIIWLKGRGATGSCAWGSFQRPANPVVRDLSERIVIASKGRFDRALAPRKRVALGLPSEASLSKDEFMEATTDIWEIPPESANRVGHPAPFPVALPARLIHLYTYRGDLVLDPFVGSGSTAIAAVRTGRHFAGYDTDPDYVARANMRLATELSHLPEMSEGGVKVVLAADPGPPSDGEDPLARALREGRSAKELAEMTILAGGFSQLSEGVKLPGGLEVSFSAVDISGGRWLFDVAGGFTSTRPGLRRSETLLRSLAKAAVIGQASPSSSLVVLTPALPPRDSRSSANLAALVGPGLLIRDVIVLGEDADLLRLSSLATGAAQRTGRGGSALRKWPGPDADRRR